jgi:two-component system sensor histidine kinase BaeS
MAEPRDGRGTIALRLALAFLGVALAAVAVAAGLTAAFTAADVSSLAGQQRAELTTAVAVAAGAAWDRGHSWATADLSPVLDLAGRTGAVVQIRGPAGRPVATSAGFARYPRAAEVARPVVVRGTPVGQAVARFTGTGLGATAAGLKTALLRAIAGAAGLAALLALLAGLGAARWLTEPVIRLIAATRARGRGDRAARVGPVPGRGELSELAAAFDQMADTLDGEEELRRALVADVAHELRTPVAVLQAGHEALLDGVAEPTPQQLGSLRDEVLRLARMVGDLQTLAEADAAALHPVLGRADLAVIAATAAASLAGQAEAAGLTLGQRLDPAPVLADAGRLHQVITNLLTNALKFTPAGGRITLESGLEGGRAVLRVADTGPGIPADELPRVFDRFWRGRQAAGVSGSGVGLAIAAELARAHGGQLTVQSPAGAGATFTLTLPRA